MAEAIFFSVAVQRIFALMEEQAKYHINLVEGAEEEVHSLGEELKNVRKKLNDAVKRSFEEEEISTWLWKLRQTSYEMDDILDEWNYALLKLEKGDAAPPKQKVSSFIPSSSCLCFKNVVVRHEIAEKVLNVKAKLDKILEEEKKYGFKTCEPTADPSPWRDQSTSFIDLEKVRGRGRDGDFLVRKLLGSESSQGVVSIVGVGGLGKTTLAQLVYNDSQVQASFDPKIWICVSDHFDLSAIGKGIFRSITGGSYGDVDQLDDLFRHVQESISGKKFLLVLDDVWTEDYKKWEHLENLLKCGGVGSKILVTTRNIRVAVTTGTKKRDTFELGVLSDDECWSILCHMACPEKNNVEFEKIGKKTAKKCKGLPIAAKTLGGILRFKTSLREWENLLNSEIWEMLEAKDELFRPLLMSYEELSPIQKQCFSYCAFFPKDFKIDVESLIRNWMALGYLGLNSGDMELKGRECFNVLAHRSLFQDFEKNYLGEIRSCKMHDIVHDFAQYLRKGNEVKGGEMNKSKHCQVCDPSQVYNVNEFCTLYWNGGSPPPNLCKCFIRSRVLSLENCFMKSFPQKMEYLIHLRSLNLRENDISTKGLKIIFQLYYLQSLNLSSCNLDEISKEIRNLSDLRHLDLSHNNLEVLPNEIGNLEKLRHLDLSKNKLLKELPNEIGNLIQLIGLCLSNNRSLNVLPNEIENLIQLKYLDLSDMESLMDLPEGIRGLQKLETLMFEGPFPGSQKVMGSIMLCGLRQLRLLKNLNHLRGSLVLELNRANLEGTVEDVQEAELKNKINIEGMSFVFEGMNESSSSSVVMDVINALEPHPNLKRLEIQGLAVSEFPLWMVSPLNQLRELDIKYCWGDTSLPSFGKLPFLEEFHVYSLKALQYVGREFLGITTQGEEGGESSSNIAFPKLKILVFDRCGKWKEWEDITAEEENSTAIQIMPCLKELRIWNCKALTALPHRLLRKASSLETLYLSNSEKLKERYNNRDGLDWKSISLNNPHLRLAIW